VTPEAVGLTAAEYERLLSQLGRNPNALELSLVGALWSEHCSYKSSKRALRWLAPAEALRARMTAGAGDNAGAIRWSDGWDVVFKVESHNHPSFVEPFSGAATGVGGIIRDVLAMGAEPVALLDSLRFGDDPARDRLLEGVVSGIAAYGNAVGVPTVGGEVAFGPGYALNPLVNVMCVGLRPADRRVSAAGARPGDRILLVGARTGRDGIGGASLLASREFHPDRSDQRPMVQVGDPFTGKLLIEAVLAALATGRVHAVQDLGASGLTSSVAELAGQSGVGARVDVDRVPLREPDLDPIEIMLSESQERMLLVAAPEDVRVVEATVARWELSAVDIGRITDDGMLTVHRTGQAVGAVPVAVLVGGAPLRDPAMPARPRPSREPVAGGSADVRAVAAMVKAVASHDAVKSHRAVYRQYDWMVKTNTVVGPGADAAVLRIAGEASALAVTVDGPGRWAAVDAWTGGSRAVLEAVMNLQVTGAEPLGLSDGLNAGSPDDPQTYRAFLEMVAGVAEAAGELAVPVTGGNVSLYNQTQAASAVRAIWPTAVIGAVGRVPRVDGAVPVGLPTIGRGGQSVGEMVLYRLGARVGDLGASVWRLACQDGTVGPAASPDWDAARAVLALLRAAHADNLVAAAHDVSDGGTVQAVVEMWLLAPDPAMAVDLDLREVPAGEMVPLLFGEDPAAAVVAVRRADDAAFRRLVASVGVPALAVGTARADGGGLRLRLLDGTARLARAELERCWLGEEAE
jgi:phosphoribosylformylglycinamidine synthase II